MKHSLIISFIIAICYWDPCLHWGGGSEGQWMGKESKGECWLEKTRHDNTNEDGWLRPADLIYLIGTLLDEYLYRGSSGEQRSEGFRQTQSHSLSHVPQANTTETDKQHLDPTKQPGEPHSASSTWNICTTHDMGSCIYVLEKSYVMVYLIISPRLHACSGMDPGVDRGYKNMSTPLIMKIGRQVKYCELFTRWAGCNTDCSTGASCCLSSWPWQDAQLDAL